MSLTANKVVRVFMPSSAICVCCVCLFLSAPVVCAALTYKDVNEPAVKSKLIYDTFVEQSFQLRMSYRFSGHFVNADDKSRLYGLAKKAGKDLGEIANRQKTILKQIEDYEANDWEDRYGETGLWKKAVRNLYTTQLSKCEVDYYFALASSESEKRQILKTMLQQVNLLGETSYTIYAHFLQAKILSLLAKIEPNFKERAEDEFNALINRADITPLTRLGIELDRIKLYDSNEPAKLKKIAQEISKINNTNNIELLLNLAFLQRDMDLQGDFENTAGLFPQIKPFLGSLVLAELIGSIEQESAEKVLQKSSIFEVELAAMAAWNSQPKNYQKLFESLLCFEKYQRPLIFYVAAIAFAESEPAKTINFLIKASALKKSQDDDKLTISADNIAAHAARLAYNLYSEDLSNCQLALNGFGNYQTLAGNKIDEELEYLYAVVLGNCGWEEKKDAVLKKIANRGDGYWSKRAALDRIKQTIQQGKLDKKQYHTLSRQLEKLLANCSKQNERECQLRTEITAVYCGLFLDAEDKSYAQKVLDMLSNVEVSADFKNLNLLKSKSLRQLGRFDEAAMSLALHSEINDDWAVEVIELLCEVVGKIDYLCLADSSARADTYCSLAFNAHRWLDSQLSGLLLAEFTILASGNEADSKQQKLSEAEQLLSALAKDGMDNNIDFIRCKARWLTIKGQFESAAKLWVKICKITQNQLQQPNRRSWNWWRARYYELYCCSKNPSQKGTNIPHTIEVLENTFDDMPVFWGQKLSLLKAHCTQ